MGVPAWTTCERGVTPWARSRLCTCHAVARLRRVTFFRRLLPSELAGSGLVLTTLASVQLVRSFQRKPLAWWAAAGMLAQAAASYARGVWHQVQAPHVAQRALASVGIPTPSLRAPWSLREALAGAVLPSSSVLWHSGLRQASLAYWTFDDTRKPLKVDIIWDPSLTRAGGAGVFLYYPGGGWVTGHRRVGSRPLLYQLASAGWVVITATYRLSPTVVWPTHLVDCKRALVWVKRNAAAFGGDPNCIVVSGDSAGGHLASLVALTPNDPSLQRSSPGVDTSVAGVVDLYGVVDLTDSGHSITRRDPARAVSLLINIVMRKRYTRSRHAYAEASPLHHVLGRPHLLRQVGMGTGQAERLAGRASAALVADAHAAVEGGILPGAEGGAGGAVGFFLKHALGVPVGAAGSPEGAPQSKLSELEQALGDHLARAAAAADGGRGMWAPPQLNVMGGLHAPTVGGQGGPMPSTLLRPRAVHMAQEGGYHANPPPTPHPWSTLADDVYTGRDQEDMGVEWGPHAEHGEGGRHRRRLRHARPFVPTGRFADAAGQRLPDEEWQSILHSEPAEQVEQPDVPPFFIIHGTNDSLVPVQDSLRMYRALQHRRAADGGHHAHGKDCLLVLPHAHHAFNYITSWRTLAAGRSVVDFVNALRSRVLALREGGQELPEKPLDVSAHALTQAKL